MVSPSRPFKCLFKSVTKQGGRHCFFRSRRSVLLRQRQVSNKVNFLQNCVLKMSFLCQNVLEDKCLVKNGSNMYFCDDGVKELVIMCDYVHFSIKNEQNQDCFLFPKGVGPWRNPCDTDTGNERSARGLAFC